MTQFEMADTKAYFTDDGKVIGQPAKSAMKHDLVLAVSNGVKISSIKIILKKLINWKRIRKGKICFRFESKFIFENVSQKFCRSRKHLEFFFLSNFAEKWQNILR